MPKKGSRKNTAVRTIHSEAIIRARKSESPRAYLNEYRVLRNTNPVSALLFVKRVLRQKLPYRMRNFFEKEHGRATKAYEQFMTLHRERSLRGERHPDYERDDTR